MSAPAFTPGPWSIIPAVEYDGDDESLVGAYTSPAGIEGSDGSPVCVFGIAEGSGTLFENERDYHLIKAAPALYAALLALAQEVATTAMPEASCERLFPHVVKANAALKQARPPNEPPLIL